MAQPEEMTVEIEVRDTGMEYGYSIGRKTYEFVRSCQKNPAIWARILARAKEIREKGLYT